jgi:hypothetical protein
MHRTIDTRINISNSLNDGSDSRRARFGLKAGGISDPYGDFGLIGLAYQLGNRAISGLLLCLTSNSLGLQYRRYFVGIAAFYLRRQIIALIQVQPRHYNQRRR